MNMRMFVVWGSIYCLFIGLLLFPSVVLSADRSDEQIITDAKTRMTPYTLKEKKCTWWQNFLTKVGAKFACASENYQNMTMPYSLGIQGQEETVKGVSTGLASDSATIATDSGEVLGFFSSLGDLAHFTKEALVGSKEKGAGALPGNFWPKQLTDKQGDVDVPNMIANTDTALKPYQLRQEKAVYVPPAENIPTGPIPTFPPTGPISESARSVRQLAKQAGDWAGVPWQIVEAMLIIEGSSYHVGSDLNNVTSGVFNLTPNALASFQQPGAKASINCNPNTCSAAGVMQLTTAGCVPFDTCEVKRDDTTNVNCNSCSAACTYKPSAWSGYKSAVLEAENDGRIPNVCNIKDSVYAATKKMKVDSGTSFGVLADWDFTTVTRVANRYYGSCVRCDTAKPGSGAKYACDRLGKTYCDFVWDYYQANKNVQVEEPQPTDQQQGSVDTITGETGALVQEIRVNCNAGGISGRVTRDNRACVDSLYANTSKSAIDEIKYSAFRWRDLQCVGFARAASDVTFGSLLQTAQSIGSAIQYKDIEPSGFAFINKKNPTRPIKSGDMLLWSIGANGHIAQVTRVYNTGLVQVAEANWRVTDGGDVLPGGVVQLRTVPLDLTSVIGWLSKL